VKIKPPELKGEVEVTLRALVVSNNFGNSISVDNNIIEKEISSVCCLLQSIGYYSRIISRYCIAIFIGSTPLRNPRTDNSDKNHKTVWFWESLDRYRIESE